MRTLSFLIVALVSGVIQAQTSTFYPAGISTFDGGTITEALVQPGTNDEDSDGPHLYGSTAESVCDSYVTNANGTSWAKGEWDGWFTPGGPAPNGGDPAFLCGGEGKVTFQGSVAPGAQSGAYVFGMISTWGTLEQRLWALGSGKWTGTLTFSAATGGQPQWDFNSGLMMKSWAGPSHVTWAWYPSDNKWHASGAIYQATAQGHSYQAINDTTDPPITGFGNFPPGGKSYAVSGWVAKGETLLHGHRVDDGIDMDTEYGSGVNKLIYLRAESIVREAITNNP